MMVMSVSRVDLMTMISVGASRPLMEDSRAAT
jgi:hypothetical protein